MIETINPGKAIVKPPRIPSDAPAVANDIPIIFEDEGLEEMGDSAPHCTVTDILGYGIESHLADNAAHEVFKNLNLHYHPDDPLPFVTPDVMVVESADRSLKGISSYRIGVQGPAPVLVTEVLSPRTAFQRDLTTKPGAYASCGVAEYLLVDPSGKFLPQRLLIRRRQPDGSWQDLQDDDGGVTSALGFRVVFDADGQIRVINAKTGERYSRPNEGNSYKREAEIAKRKAEKAEREAEMAKRIAEEAKLEAEEAKRREDEAKRNTEEAKLEAEEGKRRAEERERQAEEDRRVSRERIKELEAELARIKDTEPKSGN